MPKSENNIDENKLDSEYVKQSYNEFLSGHEEEYGYYRWQRTPVSKFHFKQSRRAFLKILGNKRYGRAFEVGGGDGVWTEILLPHVKSLDFLDISEQMILRAKKRLAGKGKVDFICGDFLKNSLSSDTYDVALSFRNFEYFPDKERGIDELSRILKTGGELIIVTKSPEYDWKGYFKKKKLHSGQISVLDLKQMLLQRGFGDIIIYPAILGKKISLPPVRWLFHLAQSAVLAMPQALPINILKKLSESYLIRALKK